MYHSDSGMDTEEIVMLYIDIGEEKIEERQAEVENRIPEAVNNSISKNGTKVLRKMFFLCA